MRYLQDLRSGDTIDLGTTRLSEADIQRFAESYDPQPQYVDESVAVPLHSGFVASPWQTILVAHGLMVKELTNHIADLGHFEIFDIRAPARIQPDRTLRAEARVKEVQDVDAAEDRGAVLLDVEMFDTDDELLGGFTSRLLVSRRPRH